LVEQIFTSPTTQYPTSVSSTRSWNGEGIPVSTQTETFRNPFKPISISTQTGVIPITPLEQHPDFFRTMTGVQAFEKAQAEEAVEKVESEKRQMASEVALMNDFISTFMFDRFKVPIDMAEELNTLLQMTKNLELDSKGKLRKDSPYNQDLYRDIDNWMDRAVQAGAANRRVSISDWSRFLGTILEFILGKNILGPRKGQVKKKTKEKLKVLKKNLLDENALQVNTNIPRVRGPKAPTRTDFPPIQKSNVSTTNIIEDKRRRRGRG
jgi:hypothetical protein